MANDTTLLVATVTNEGPNILEWVAHHRLCGFDHIQIFQHDSTDTTLQTLRMLDRIGAIEFHNTGAHQMRAYRRASRSDAFRDSAWCMALDCEEFLNVKTGDRSVHALVGACPEDTTTILVPWRMFGSNGQQDFAGELVTERFTRSEPGSAIRTTLTPVKSIFRTDAFQRPGIYLPRDPSRTDLLTCNASGLTEDAFERKNWRATDPGERKFAQINRYLRDLPSFLLKQGNPDTLNHDESMKHWTQHDRNEEEDASLAKHAFDVWAEMKRLDAETGGKLLALRSRGLRQWRLALDKVMEDDRMVALRDSIVCDQTASNAGADAVLPSPTPVFSSVRAGPTRFADTPRKAIKN